MDNACRCATLTIRVQAGFRHSYRLAFDSSVSDDVSVEPLSLALWRAGAKLAYDPQSLGSIRPSFPRRLCRLLQRRLFCSYTPTTLIEHCREISIDRVYRIFSDTNKMAIQPDNQFLFPRVIPQRDVDHSCRKELMKVARHQRLSGRRLHP